MRKEHGYILRYYLPIKPYFEENYTEKRFIELISFCKETKTKAVMFYVSLDPSWYYMPSTPDYEEQVVEQMLPYIKRLRKEGLGYQLNFQNLLGAVHGGGDFTEKMDWEPIVDQKGNSALGVGCPIGKVFREKTAKRLSLWASTHPDVIWIDDDFRLNNHGSFALTKIKGQPYYDDYYCYCDNHIQLFNERNNSSYDRESLVREILKEGEPSEIRIKYLEFLKDTMKETASWISSVVHGVDKKIKVAQMTSFIESHATENRDWKSFLTALCGEHKPIIRPHFGPYRETNPKNFTHCYMALAKTMTAVSSYGEGVEFCPEIENTRFTTWTKSAKATAYQLGLSAFMGAKDTTLSIYDLDGGAFFDEPAYKQLLKSKKKKLNKITSLGLEKAKLGGVICPLMLDSGKRYRLNKGDDYFSITWKNKNIDEFLTGMGIPCRYSTSILQEVGTFAIDGYSANVLTDQEIEHILKQSVLIDGKGAEVLLSRGFGDKIGVKSIDSKKVTVNAEIIKKFARKDGTYIRIPSRVPPLCWNKIQYSEKATILSEFLTAEGEKAPALTRFYNKDGGKVVIYPAFNDWGDGLYNDYRLRLFKEVLTENDKDLNKIDTSRHSIVVEKKLNNNTYYFISNLSTDTLKEVSINGKKIKTNLLTYGFIILKVNGKRIRKVIKDK